MADLLMILTAAKPYSQPEGGAREGLGPTDQRLMGVRTEEWVAVDGLDFQPRPLTRLRVPVQGEEESEMRV